MACVLRPILVTISGAIVVPWLRFSGSSFLDHLYLQSGVSKALPMQRIALKHEARNAKIHTQKQIYVAPLLDRFTTVALNAAQLLHQQEWKDKFNTLS